MTHPLDPDARDDALAAKVLPRDEDNLPAVVNDVDEQQIKHYVTPLKSFEQQVGEHIIAALQSPETVAVVTTVVSGPAGQQVVSAGLDPAMMQEVQKLLQQAEEKRKPEVPCIGFHCFIEPKDDEERGDDAETDQAS